MPPESMTFRLAQELWSEAGPRLEPAEFQSCFDAIYESAHNSSGIDLSALWQLGGAANDYLRLNAQAAQAMLDCRDLPLLLLRSKMTDARIIGLKLLNRLKQDPDEIILWISRALASKKDYEVMGGLYELGQFLDYPSCPAMEMKFAAKGFFEILKSLSNAPDTDIRESADRYIDWIATL